MDTAVLALKLIEAYKAEHNRYRRARAKKLKILSDSDWTLQMNRLGLNYLPCGPMTAEQKNRELKRARNYFRNNDIDKKFTVRYFVSQGIKSSHIRKARRSLAILKSHHGEQNSFVVEKREELQKLKDTSVKSVLGKKWRELVDA